MPEARPSAVRHFSLGGRSAHLRLEDEGITDPFRLRPLEGLVQKAVHPALSQLIARIGKTPPPSIFLFEPIEVVSSKFFFFHTAILIIIQYKGSPKNRADSK